MTTEQIFEAGDSDDYANRYAQHMPVGWIWNAKNVTGTVMRAFVAACATPFRLVNEIIFLVQNDFHVPNCTFLLEEWEESVGLPDSCFGQTNDIVERRNRILQRLARSPLVTLQQFQEYVDLLFPNIRIKLRPGTEVYSFAYTFEFEFWGAINEKFVIVADVPPQGERFEYDFEFPFEGATDFDLLRCAMRRIMPANVALHIREVNFIEE